MVKNTPILKMADFPEIVNGIKLSLINYINRADVSEYWDKLEQVFKDSVG